MGVQSVIGYGCVVGWWDEFQQYVVPQVGDRRVYGDGPLPDRPLIALSGQTSIARAYNVILKAFWYQYGAELEAVILLHTDLTITDPDGEAKIVAACQEPDVALVSVEGGDGDRGTEWWECNPIGHQAIDRFYIDFAGQIPGAEVGPPDAARTKPRARSGDVAVLEGSILAFSPWAVQHLRFDEYCPAAFHGYDEVCFQARQAGKRCVVVDVDTHHHTSGAYKGQQSSDEWKAANEWTRKKWGKS